MIDSDRLLVELRGRIAEKPSWGRAELLQLMAELDVRHSVEEDELDRALRLVMPQMLDLLFNRAPELAQAVSAALEGSPASHVGVDSDARAMHRVPAIR